MGDSNKSVNVFQVGSKRRGTRKVKAAGDTSKVEGGKMLELKHFLIHILYASSKGTKRTGCNDKL